MLVEDLLSQESAQQSRHERHSNDDGEQDKTMLPDRSHTLSHSFTVLTRYITVCNVSLSGEEEGNIVGSCGQSRNSVSQDGTPDAPIFSGPQNPLCDQRQQGSYYQVIWT